MLPDQLPSCACGNHKWAPGGAQLGGEINSQWFTCGCGRPALLIFNRCGCILLQPAGELLQFDDAKLNEWLNKMLLPVWRDFSERLEETQKPIKQTHWDQLCDQLGIPRGTKTPDVPEDRQKEWHSGLDALYNKLEYRYPDGFRDQPIPPNLAAYNMTAAIKTLDDEWKLVDAEASANAEVPPDPIRVHHDQYFKEVFTAVRAALSIEISPVEVENLYSGNTALQPWYLFGINGIGIRVGPRKRVDMIHVEVPKHRQPIETQSIREVAMADQVTYRADDGWQSDIATARSIEVHAWDKEKLIEYLTIIGRQALATS